MSKKKKIDIIALVAIPAFLVLYFLLPQVSGGIQQSLCTLDVMLNVLGCYAGRLVFFALPMLAAMWLLVRGFGKLMQFL